MDDSRGQRLHGNKRHLLLKTMTKENGGKTNASFSDHSLFLQPRAKKAKWNLSVGWLVSKEVNFEFRESVFLQWAVNWVYFHFRESLSTPFDSSVATAEDCRWSDPGFFFIIFISEIHEKPYPLLCRVSISERDYSYPPRPFATQTPLRRLFRTKEVSNCPPSGLWVTPRKIVVLKKNPRGKLRPSSKINMPCLAGVWATWRVEEKALGPMTTLDH